MLGDDPEDYMARSAVKWLLRLGVNVLTMSPGKKDYEHGTHFVFPDGMLKTMLPIGSALFVKLAFSAAKKYPSAKRRALTLTAA